MTNEENVQPKPRIQSFRLLHCVAERGPWTHLWQMCYNMANCQGYTDRTMWRQDWPFFIIHDWPVERLDEIEAALRACTSYDVAQIINNVVIERLEPDEGADVIGEFADWFASCYDPTTYEHALRCVTYAANVVVQVMMLDRNAKPTECTNALIKLSIACDIMHGWEAAEKEV